MARYIDDNRDTELFVAGSLETLLQQNAVARTIGAALARLDFAEFDAWYKNDEGGRPALNPRSLAAVWILALLRGVTSSVRLAELCGKDIEFRWLLGGSRVEKSTLCDFRKAHHKEISSLGSQVLVALGQSGLLPGENLGMDGTIVRAASSRHSVKTRKGLNKQRERVETLLHERLSEDAQDNEALTRHQRFVAQALGLMDSLGLNGDEDRLTVTEPSAKLLRQKNGSYAPGYNIQAVPDLDSGVIIHAEVVDAGNDCGQLKPRLEKARTVLKEIGAGGDSAPSVAADGAYHDTLQLVELEKQGVDSYVPEDRNANRAAPGVAPEYYAQAFSYDEQNDTMTCPQGHCLKRRKLNEGNTAMVYQASTQTCQTCPAKPRCCPKSKSGRCVSRPLYKEAMETVAKRLETAKGRRMKRARWVVCEGVFARLNGLLHWGRCRMWGRAGVEAELAWRQFTHNLMLLCGIWKPMVIAENTA